MKSHDLKKVDHVMSYCIKNDDDADINGSVYVHLTMPEDFSMKNAAWHGSDCKSVAFQLTSEQAVSLICDLAIALPEAVKLELNHGA